MRIPSNNDSLHNDSLEQRFNSFIKEALNEQQQQAVLQKEGSLLVVAGAGSGKTRVITARIAHLMLNEAVSADAIVALTFTNKAAKEMQERIAHFCGDRQTPFIGTFHSYCLRLLKSNQELLDHPFFTILDADDQEKLLKTILQRKNVTKQNAIKPFLYQISSIKNQGLDKEALHMMFMQQPQLQEIYQAYEAEKRLSKCLDFDDLLLEGLKLFSHKDFKKRFQETVRHILVDEYQDTNVVQHALLKAMALKGPKKLAADSMCVVGDEDQSIYSWRGATVANMVNFAQDFPDTTLVKIEQNYRSVQSILDIANHVIQHNKQRTPKKLWSAKKGHNRIRSMTAVSEYQEGDAIAQLCKIMMGQKKLSSCAVLYRTHFQSRAIEEALIRHAIPYKIFGGIQFYERKEIKDLIAYMRLIVNPFDRTSLFRIINYPSRGLGDAFETLFYERWSQEPFLTFIELAQRLLDEQLVKGKKAETLTDFIAVFKDLDVTVVPSKALALLVTRSNYDAAIKEDYDLQEGQVRLDNIRELLRAIEHFENEQKGTLDQFLQEVALMQEKANKQQEDQDALLLMTLHAAKGLEFDTVILVGFEEGLLPSSRSLHDDEAIQEERRLFYVGITRARERLLLSKTRYRYTYGKMTDQIPSRFLKEVPEHLIIAHDIGNMQLHTIKQWFAQWLDIAIMDAIPPVLTFGATSKPTKQVIQPPVRAKATAVKATFHAAWRINQPVSHKTFGIGIIKKIEERNGKTMLTIRFKDSTKTVLASFLEKI